MKSCIFLTISLFCTLLNNSVLAQQQPQQCQGIEILYPKTDSIIDKTEDQSTYLILGNTLSNNILKKVDILYEKQDGNEQLSDTVWTGQDELLKVSAIQQDLNKLQDFPNTYWFRVFIQQNGDECQLESGRFKIK